MGRQENIEIFEDSQRMYESNPRLISAIKKSNEKQEFFAGDCQIMADAGRVYEKAARIIVSKKRTLEAAAAYAEKQVCIFYAVVHDHLREIEVEDVPAFEEGLYDYLDTRAPAVLDAIRESGRLSEETEEQLKEALKAYQAQFAALPR